VREFNRYGTTTQLRMESIAPGTRRYGGVFDADDPESFAVLLEREKDLRVERRGRDIVISRR
jgi:ferric-dicitrate binding protein FerR (iron transport regulator)